MSPAFRPFSVARIRQRIALAMAVAVLIGGIAQASHYHKGEFERNGQVHQECLLCQHSAGTAGPPTIPRLVLSEPICVATFVPSSVVFSEGQAPSSYDARGPPLV